MERFRILNILVYTFSIVNRSGFINFVKKKTQKILIARKLFPIKMIKALQTTYILTNLPINLPVVNKFLWANCSVVFILSK